MSNTYSKNVGVKAVQEVQTSVAYYGASEAWVITNVDYTEQAYILAKSNSVRLINREELIEMILRIKSAGKAKSQAKAVDTTYHTNHNS
ncbi:restriction endonuclease [Paenibacillus sp. GCM10012307]|uniref:restriction endonuclease n=1 Tax=Paenibacillus TaxID=44249 RepID=UPI001E4239F3|nr:restriction endonuclease [Paenibacillus roseus]